MSVYDQNLPKAFPYSVVVPEGEAEPIVSYLLSKKTSFAVTQDRPETIWLSEASMKHFETYSRVPRVEDLGRSALIEYASGPQRYWAIRTGAAGAPWAILIEKDRGSFEFNHNDIDEYVQNQIETATSFAVLSEGIAK